MLPLLRVRVVGPSMEPALRNGDWVLVRRNGRVRAGDIVLLAHPERPGLLVVKRLVRREAEGWVVLGDNPGASDDSRRFGPVPASSIVGRVTLRYWPLRRGR